MKDSIIVITGASSGIGAALAEAVVERGAKVVLAARRQGELRDQSRDPAAGVADPDIDVAVLRDRLVAQALEVCAPRDIDHDPRATR